MFLLYIQLCCIGNVMKFLLDASALLNDPNFRFEEKNSYITTTQIMDEWKTIEVKFLAENALHKNILKIEEPEPNFLEEIVSLVKKYGFNKLSKPDISLLALSLQHKSKNEDFTVVTDDFSIQNFLKILKIPFFQAIQGKIDKILSLKNVCPGCSRIFKDPNLKTCDFCGSRLKKVPIFK
ncbi:MAG: hypothetical protein COT15_00075 [Candidatus Diapherotrites archaeon CG08_land_8_20_14_0_20_34_12]|nr:MAG: hypothetical protein COT15_00075 [Candidatus Diapherotrites archaeon CG08_land_8_20_14_0_20_34_12]